MKDFRIKVTVEVHAVKDLTESDIQKLREGTSALLTVSNTEGTTSVIDLVIEDITTHIPTITEINEIVKAWAAANGHINLVAMLQGSKTVANYLADAEQYAKERVQEEETRLANLSPEERERHGRFGPLFGLEDLQDRKERLERITAYRAKLSGADAHVDTRIETLVERTPDPTCSKCGNLISEHPIEASKLGAGCPVPG